MSTDTKICPQCDAEFFAHISECNGCRVPLISPDAPAPQGTHEAATAIPEAAPPEFAPGLTPGLTKSEPHIVSHVVSIEQGDIAKIDELHRALKARNIPSQVIVSKQSCGGGFILQVPEYNVEIASAAIEDHWQKLHPELKEAATREESGQCPACGFKLDQTPEDCPDCGLSLGGAPDPDDCSDDSGSCGPC